MARIIKPLTVKQIEAAQPKAQEYFLYDGDNLRLKITPNNIKTWVYTFEWEGKQKKTTIGVFKKSKSDSGVGITLEQARIEKEKFKTMLSHGECPQSEKKALKQLQHKKEVQKEIFNNKIINNIIHDYFNFITYDSESHKKRQLSRINRMILPFVDNKMIDNITTKDILNCIDKIKTTEEKHRVLTLCGQIWRWAKSNDRAERNIIVDIDRKNTLPQKTQTSHYRTITDENRIKDLLQSIDQYKGNMSTRIALKLAPYVVLRPKNIRLGEWNEIDFEKKLWIIPSHKMKTKKEHIVPLTDTMIDIINYMRPFSYKKSVYIFPSPISNSKPLSENTLNYGLQRLGFGEEIVTHGFRAMFSTIANEHIDDDNAHGVSRDIIEFQMAHAIDNKVGAAYNRALYLKQRTKLIQWWSDYLDQLKNS